MLDKQCNASTVKKPHMDSSNSVQAPAPPPYSQFEYMYCIGKSGVDSVTQLLEKKNLFHIRPGRSTGRNVVDGNNTLLLSILSQPLHGVHWQIENKILDPTGKKVMEVQRLIDPESVPAWNKAWGVYVGNRVAGILNHLDRPGKSELVGFSNSGKEIFRGVELGPYSLALSDDGEDLALITTKPNLWSTSLVILDQDLEMEVKALILCTANFFEGLCRRSAIPDVSGGCEIVPMSQQSTSGRVASSCTSHTKRQGTKRSIRISGALDNTTVKQTVISNSDQFSPCLKWSEEPVKRKVDKRSTKLT